MSLHKDIIEELVANKFLFESMLGISDSKIETESSFSGLGDIDVKVCGIDYLTQESVVAIVEVKSHKGLVPHYIKHQLPKYINSFPDAKQFVLYSTSGSNFKDFVLEKH